MGEHPAVRVVGEPRLGHHNLRVRTLGLSLMLIVAVMLQFAAAARAAGPATGAVPSVSPALELAHTLVSDASDGAGTRTAVADIVATATSGAAAAGSNDAATVRILAAGAPAGVLPTPVAATAPATATVPATATATGTTPRRATRVQAADRRHAPGSRTSAALPRLRAVARGSRLRPVLRSRRDLSAPGLAGVLAVAIKQLDAIQTQALAPPSAGQGIPTLTSWLESLARLAPPAGIPVVSAPLGSAPTLGAVPRAHHPKRTIRSVRTTAPHAPGRGALSPAVARVAAGPRWLAISPAISAAPRAHERSTALQDRRVRRVRRSAPAPAAVSAARTPPMSVALDSGASAAGAGGAAGPGSSAIVIVTALGMGLLQLFSSRLSLELGPWRSAVFASRLERPG